MYVESLAQDVEGSGIASIADAFVAARDQVLAGEPTDEQLVYLSSLRAQLNSQTSGALDEELNRRANARISELRPNAQIATLDDIRAQGGDISNSTIYDADDWDGEAEVLY